MTPRSGLSLSHDVEVATVSDGRLLLTTANGYSVQQLSPLTRALCLAENGETAQNIAECLATEFSFGLAHAFLVLEVLLARKLLRLRSIHEASRRLNATFEPLSSSLPISFVEAAECAGINLTSGEVTVVETNDYNDIRLDAIGRKYLHEGRPWLLVSSHPADGMVGPLFGPSSVCWACTKKRVGRNKWVSSTLRRHASEENGIIRFEDSSSSSTLWLIVRFLLECQQHNVLYTYGVEPLSIERHSLEPDPYCPDCGDRTSGDSEVAPVSYDFHHSAVTGTGYRIVSSKTTYSRVSSHVDKITGIVNELKEVHGLPNGVYLYTAGLDLTGQESLETLLAGNLSTSVGKGLTAIQAKVSAICESLERYCFIFDRHVNCFSSSYREVKDDAVDPALLVVSDQRSHISPSSVLHWTPAWSLKDKKVKYVPTAFCYRACPALEQRFFNPNSTGNAAGNNVQEAIVHGLLEIAERLNLHLWWCSGEEGSGAMVEFPRNKTLRDMQASLERMGYDVRLIQIGLGIPVPTVCALALRESNEGLVLALGAGAHFDPEVAAARAVLELAQKIPALTDPSNSRRTVHSREEISFLNSGGLKKKKLTHGVVNLSDLVRALGEEGDVLYLDMTRADVRVDVVRCICPEVTARINGLSEKRPVPINGVVTYEYK